MRNRYRLILVTIATLMLTACGGGGGGGGTSTPTTETADNSGTPTQPSNTVMAVGEAYTIKQGDAIIKQSDPTVVVIETDIDTGVTTATLQSGSATIH